MSAWTAVLLVGLGSYGLRLAPLLLADRLVLSASAQRTLRHAGAAALSGLLALSLAGVAGHEQGAPAAAVAALVTATAVAVTRRSMLAVVGSSAAVYVVVGAASSLLGG